ncbi:MAG: HlyC/CorC family transporter [Actinobacteria bacterium]|nr:HlyC/CorC family transporter [Actinomycetota bacterium]
MNVGALVVITLLLAMNGFFVAVEFSLVASRRTKLEELATEGSRAATIGFAATRDLTLELAGAQLGITVASLALGFVAEPAMIGVLEIALGPLELPRGVEQLVAFVIGLGIVVFFHLVIGEMVPKGIALADPERTLLRVAWPNYFYMRLFRPIIQLLNASSNVIVRAMRVEVRDELSRAHTAEELAVLLAESHEEGVIEDFAHDLLAGVLDFGGETAESVMVPREDMVSVTRSTTVAEAERVVVATGHSRLPVLGSNGADDVLGFVHSKDLLTTPAGTRHQALPLPMIRRLLVVPRSRSLEDVLLSMRFSRVHVAIVRDDDGRTVGLVTLEDLLEELVGDILDESDTERGEGLDD